MGAIYAKELKSYFSSMLGYIICAFMMAATGVFFTGFCLVNGSTVFGVVISNIGFMLFIVIPIITMRIFADEEKLKTEQLLFSSAISIFDIVVGKFLAAYTLFSLTVLEMCIFPLIIAKYTNTSYAMAYTTILAYWLLGGVLIAIGMLVSSLTDNSISAAIISFMLMLGLYMTGTIVDLFSTEGYISLIALIIIIIAVAYIIYRLSADKRAVSVIAIMAIVSLVIAYFVKTEVFSGLIATVLNAIAVFDKLSYFIYGAFDGKILIYYLTIIGLFLFLTMKSLQKRRWS